MPPRSPAASDDIRMSAVVAALRRCAPWLALSSILAGALTFAVLSLTAPRYQSEAELAIVAKGAPSAFADPRSMSASPDIVSARMDREAISTHVRAMQSPELMEQIAEALSLKNRREFNSALGPIDMLDRILRLVGISGPKAGESEHDRVLATLHSELEVYSVKESRFIGVRMTSTDPVLAADVANGIAEAYRTSLAKQGVGEIDDQQSRLRAKIDKLAPEVAAAEAEADQYRARIDWSKGASQSTGLYDQQMAEMTAALTRAKAVRGETVGRAKSAREMMQLGSADALPDVQKSSLIQNLVQQRTRIERQISELSAKLLPAHPRMRQLNADLANVKLQINGEVAKIVENFDKEAKVAQSREDSISHCLEELKARVVTSAAEEARLRQLDATAKAQRAELDNLQSQFEVNRKKLDARPQPIEARIISRAQPASVPSFPKKRQLSVLFGVAMAMLGIAWTVAGALFASTRGGAAPTRPKPADRRAEPLLSEYQEPLVSELREAVSAPARPPLNVKEKDFSGLVGRIFDRRPAHGGYRVLLTGASDDVEASVEAIALVKALTEKGAAAILVDWSPSGNGLAGAAAHLEASRGFNDLLADRASFEDVVARLPDSSAHAIASGRALGLLPETIDPELVNLLLDALDEVYDFIIVAGRHDEACKLFEVIEGRFDAGISVCEVDAGLPHDGEAPGTFLGYQVTGIDVFRYQRAATERRASARIQRVVGARQQQLKRHG